MKYKNYYRPKTLEEAYSLAQNRNTVILGGNFWLHQQSRSCSSVIDLSDLGLDGIAETENGICIGAYTSLRKTETEPLLCTYAGDAFHDALSPIVGVQFRNTATIGGSVCGRFGFSDVLTLLSALDASVVFFHAGMIPVSTYAKEGKKNDILTNIFLPKEKPDSLRYIAQRNQSADFPVLTAAVCRRGDKLTVSVGARPLRAETLVFPLTEEKCSAEEIAEKTAGALLFGSNRMASAEYRRHLCRVLVSRAIASM